MTFKFWCEDDAQRAEEAIHRDQIDGLKITNWNHWHPLLFTSPRMRPSKSHGPVEVSTSINQSLQRVSNTIGDEKYFDVSV